MPLMTGNRYTRTERQIESAFVATCALATLLGGLLLCAGLAGVVWLWGEIL